MLVLLKEHNFPTARRCMVPDRYVRASDFDGKLGQANNPEWKTVAFDETRQGRAAARRDRLPLGAGRPRRRRASGISRRRRRAAAAR